MFVRGSDILLFFHDMETFPHYCPFVKGTNQSTVDSHHKRPTMRRFIISLIVVWTGCLKTNRATGDSKLHDAHVIISVAFELQIYAPLAFTRVSPPSVTQVRKPLYLHTMMTSSNRNIFRVTGHLCGEFTGHRWIPHTKASDAELWCFLWFARE